MPRTSRFLFAVVYGWTSLIGIARSADSDPSLFFPDGVSPSTTDIGNTRGELSSDLFSGSDSVFDQTDLDSGFGTDAVLMSLDPQWLSFDDSDLGVLEASCTGDNGGTQTIDKMRREDRQTCAQQLRKNNPDFSNLQLPTFMQIEETLKGAQTKPDVNAGTASEEEDDDECPEPYGRRVCCSGRGVRTFEGSGIWDFVHGCNPRVGACPYGTQDFCCKVVGNSQTAIEWSIFAKTEDLNRVGQACVLYINKDYIRRIIF